MKAEEKTESKDSIFFKKLSVKSCTSISTEVGKKVIDEVHKFFEHIGSSNDCKNYSTTLLLDQRVAEFCSKCTVCIQNKSHRHQTLVILSVIGWLQLKITFPNTATLFALQLVLLLRSSLWTNAAYFATYISGNLLKACCRSSSSLLDPDWSCFPTKQCRLHWQW